MHSMYKAIFWRQNLPQNNQSWRHCVFSCPVTLLCNWRNKKCLECKQIRTNRILKITSCVCIFNLNYICLLVWCAHTSPKVTSFQDQDKKNQQIFLEIHFVICKQWKITWVHVIKCLLFLQKFNMASLMNLAYQSYVELATLQKSVGLLFNEDECLICFTNILMYL